LVLVPKLRHPVQPLSNPQKNDSRYHHVLRCL
jgi:hypothetical protein